MKTAIKSKMPKTPKTPVKIHTYEVQVFLKKPISTSSSLTSTSSIQTLKFTGGAYNNYNDDGANDGANQKISSIIKNFIDKFAGNAYYYKLSDVTNAQDNCYRTDYKRSTERIKLIDSKIL